MRFYGCSLEEVRAMDPMLRWVLISDMGRIRARESLELMNVFSAVHAVPEQAKRFRARLVEVAMENDPEAMMEALEAVTRN